jgi:hypothetical protein
MDWFNFYQKRCAELKSTMNEQGFSFENNEIEALVLLSMATQAKMVGLNAEVNQLQTLITKVLKI